MDVSAKPGGGPLKHGGATASFVGAPPSFRRAPPSLVGPPVMAHGCAGELRRRASHASPAGTELRRSGSEARRGVHEPSWKHLRGSSWRGRSSKCRAPCQDVDFPKKDKTAAGLPTTSEVRMDLADVMRATGPPRGRRTRQGASARVRACPVDFSTKDKTAAPLLATSGRGRWLPRMVRGGRSARGRQDRPGKE